MLSDVIRYIRGYVRIRITGYSTERFLNTCSHREIYIWELKPVSGAYEMNLLVQDFRKLKPVIKKTGTKVSIVGRFGLPFLLHRYRKRKIFFAGGLLCIVFIILMSRYIWNIDISGNLSRTDDTLLKFLESKEVKNGMLKSDVDCDRIVKDIRKEYDDIIWVSASIEGTRLIIQIKENDDADIVTDKETEEDEDMQEKSGFTTQVESPTDIVADMDCVITEIVVRNGITTVSEGAEVKKGDVLVSGQVPVNNDAGEVIAYQYHESDADIMGRATVHYQDDMKLTYTKKTYQEQRDRTSFFLMTDTYELEILPIRKYEGQSYELHTAEYRLRLGDGFYLPFSCGVKRAYFYETSQEKYTKEEIQSRLTAKFTRYCEDLEKKGVEIIENNVKIYTRLKTAEAEGDLTIITPVGETVSSELLEVPTVIKEESGE